jgi:hypothetical protein
LFLEVRDCPQDLSHLVRLGFALVTLNIYPWLTLPRRPVDSVASGALPRLAEKVIAYPDKLFETYPSRVTPHLFDHVIDRSHNNDITIDITVKVIQPSDWRIKREPETCISLFLLWF